MLKKMLLMLLASLATSTPITAQNDPIADLFQGRPWEYLEYKLILKPEQECTSWKNSLFSYATGGLVGTAAGYVTHRGISSYVPDRYQSLRTKLFAQCTAIPLITLLSSRSAYRLLTSMLERNYKYQAFKNIIINWHQQRAYLPETIHTSCQRLHETYQLHGESSDFKQLALQVMDILYNQIYGHFFTKYRERLEPKRFFDESFLHTIITCDITELIKAIFYISKTVFVEHKK